MQIFAGSIALWWLKVITRSNFGSLIQPKPTKDGSSKNLYWQNGLFPYSDYILAEWEKVREKNQREEEKGGE